MKNMEMTVR